ncbi:MAG: helix-turn-helix transcriptional regulator [Bacillota bacterium]|nr:transcriptional regulator [Bacillota bacterium]
MTKRQEQILQIVKDEGPITGEKIAEKLNLTRATLRPDLAILTMAGYLDARPRVGYFYAGKTGNQLLAERLRKMKVGDYKARPVVIREASSVYDAITTLFLEDVGTLYVVNEEGLLAGVVSRKDLLRAALGGKRLEDLPVGVIMTRMPNIITVTPEDSLYDAAKKLIDYEVDSLPVIVEVKEKGPRAFEVVGRVTKTTITRAFVELGQSDR